MLARAVARIEIIAERTERRVPLRARRALDSAGIRIHSAAGDPSLPMHDKFALVEARGLRDVAFGSLNWTDRSRWLNRELLAIARDDRDLFHAFAQRWQQLRGG